MSLFDTLTAWIFDSNKCRNGQVRFQALMPEFYNNRFETSVYGCHNMASEDIWKLNVRTDREPKGRAEFPLTLIDTLRNVSLERDPAPSQHGNIIGWPDDKDARMEIAKEWADNSVFKAYPN